MLYEPCTDDWDQQLPDSTHDLILLRHLILKSDLSQILTQCYELMKPIGEYDNIYQ